MRWFLLVASFVSSSVLLGSGCVIFGIDIACASDENCPENVVCDESRGVCMPICGNGIVEGDEECDYDVREGPPAPVNGDGCSEFCRVEPGYKCVQGEGCYVADNAVLLKEQFNNGIGDVDVSATGEAYAWTVDGLTTLNGALAVAERREFGSISVELPYTVGYENTRIRFRFRPATNPSIVFLTIGASSNTYGVELIVHVFPSDRRRSLDFFENNSLVGSASRQYDSNDGSFQQDHYVELTFHNGYGCATVALKNFASEGGDVLLDVKVNPPDHGPNVFLGNQLGRMVSVGLNDSDNLFSAQQPALLDDLIIERLVNIDDRVCPGGG